MVHTSASQKRRRATPQHKRSARRRAANRLSQLVTVLAVLSLAIALFFFGMAWWHTQRFAEDFWLVGLAYLGGALFCLLIRAVFSLNRRIVRRSSRPVVRAPDKPPAPTEPQKSGMVLILTLVLLGVMAALILHLQHAARLTRQTETRLLQQARLRVALIDETFRRLEALGTDEDQHVVALDSPHFDQVEVERPDGIITLSRMTDLNRYVDLNNLWLGEEFPGPNLTEDILIEAMTQAGDLTPIERLQALREWIDPSEDGIRSSDYYAQRDPPYRTPNTWLHSWNELRWVAGFGPDYFEEHPWYRAGQPFTANMVDLITIVPGPRSRPVPININTASAYLLEAAMGPERSALARYILLARAERPFRSLDALLSRVDPALFTLVRPFLDVRSTHFLLEVAAIEDGHRLAARAVAHRDRDGKVNILQWTL